MDKPLLTPEFARRVIRAIELNRDEPGDIYHHPSEKAIVPKCIDLYCHKPLHEIGNKPKSDSPRSGSRHISFGRQKEMAGCWN